MPEEIQSQPATVIITQAVPAELTEKFEELQSRLTERVKTFQGFIGNEILPPREGIQDSWVVIFRFNCPDSLRRWLSSTERTEIIAEIEQLLPDAPQIQILAEPPKDHVTVVFSHRIKEGHEEDYRNWRARILAAQQSCKGFLGQESFDPVDGLTREWVDIARFANKEALDNWMKSSDRKRLLGELDPMVDQVEIKRVGTGLDGWFRGSSGGNLVEAPPSWKQALSVWLALYPTVMLLTYYFNPLLGHMDFPLLMLIGNALSVSILTWVLMPFVNKLLGFWLLPKKRKAIIDVGFTIVLLLLLVVFWRIFVVLPH